MDLSTFIDNLKVVFCDSSKTEYKYAEVWLTEADFGGLYKNGKYVLNIKKTKPVISSFDEIRDVFELIYKEAPQEASLIWSVKLFNPKDADCLECESEGAYPVFNQAEACA